MILSIYPAYLTAILKLIQSQPYKFSLKFSKISFYQLATAALRLKL